MCIHVLLEMEVELSKQRHAGDLHEKERLSRIMGNKEIYQEKVAYHRQAETDRLKREREDRISRILQSRKQEREKMRKLKYFLQVEEERPQELLLQKQIVGANSSSKPDGDRWDRNSSFGYGGGRSSTTWSSSRVSRDRH
ncbi:unnamed protein product [Trifolium pratense]|uniref:Uncharacterized protein n=1 Tax=Trifolium pratense TaxID=57577 RepID=A0ACB0M4N5_TRIPR|nr:unnamed protein product [Trifolium pratense]